MLSDKFLPIALPDILAPRRTLMKMMTNAAQSRYVSVVAPAGYGKSVSTLLWLSAAKRESIWIGLDIYDNAPTVFYKLLCKGIVSAQPDNTQMRDILKSPYFAANPVDSTMKLLLEFEPCDRQFAVVLDDLHFITSEEILKSLPYVIKRLPSNMSLFVLSRRPLPPLFEDTLGASRFQHITADQLSFQLDDINDYFQALGKCISAEDAQEILTVTQGWAIGITAVAKSGELGDGPSGNLTQYIQKQIWNDLEEPLQYFLLQTAIVEEVTPALCQALTGRADAEAVLYTLCRTISFVRNMPDGTYHYHHLLLEFLRNCQTPQVDRKKLFAIAAEYYLAKDEYYLATRYAYESEKKSLIVKVFWLLNQNNAKYASIEDFVTSCKSYFINSTQPEKLNIPHTNITHVWYNYLIGNAPKMEFYMDKLYQALPRIAIQYPKLLETAILVISLDHRTPFAKQIEQFRFLPPVTTKVDTQQGTSVTANLPFMHRTNRDYSCLSDDAMMKRFEKSFGKLLKGNYDIIQTNFNACFALERNALQEALSLSLRGVACITASSASEVAFCAHMNLIATYAVLQQQEAYARAVDNVTAFIEETKAYYLRANLKAYLMWQTLLHGDVTAAKAWLASFFVIETTQLALYRVFQQFTTVRAYIVLAQLDKARVEIQKLIQLATDFRRPMDLAEATMLLAVVSWQEGKAEEAQQLLETALTTVAPFGFLRVIANEGAAILPVLKKIVAKLAREQDSALDTAFVNAVYVAAYEQSKHYAGITAGNQTPKRVKLSKQQKMILSLLAKGHTNAQICQALGLKITTVKSHTSLIYTKLQVNNYLDAVSKARTLGLVD